MIDNLTMYAARSIYVLQHAGSLAVRRRVKHTLCSTQNGARSIKKKLDTSDQQLWTFHTAAKCGGAGVEEDVRWLHPADEGTVRMEGAHQERMLQFPTPFTVNTAQPLQRDRVGEALSHLWRKVPALRTCLRYRYGRLWLCELKKPTLDFEVVETSEPLREVMVLTDERFKSAEGPLWRARLMCNISDVPFEVSEIKARYPHQCNFLFSFHHGVVDGSSSMVILDAFIKILDNVIGRIPVSEDQIGINRDEAETLKLLKESEEIIENNPHQFRSLWEQCSTEKFVPLLTEAYGQPNISELKTHYLIFALPQSTTSRFIVRCKNAQVTLNSGVATALNIAFVDLMLEAGVVRDVYNVTGRHAVNLRKYWEPHTEWPFGCHISGLSHISPTPLDVKEKSWEYARQYNTEIRYKLKNKYVFKEESVKRKLYGKDVNYDELFSKPQPLIFDYAITNVNFAVTPEFGNGDHVQLTNILTPSVLHHADFGIMFMVVNFRGRLQGTISYSTGHITDDIAKRLRDKVLEAVNHMTL